MSGPPPTIARWARQALLENVKGVNQNVLRLDRNHPAYRPEPNARPDRARTGDPRVFLERNTVQNYTRFARRQASLFYEHAARVFAHEHDFVGKRKNCAIVTFSWGHSSGCGHAVPRVENRAYSARRAAIAP